MKEETTGKKINDLFDLIDKNHIKLLKLRHSNAAYEYKRAVDKFNEAYFDTVTVEQHKKIQPGLLKILSALAELKTLEGRLEERNA
jgi:hypothetical protein